MAPIFTEIKVSAKNRRTPIIAFLEVSFMYFSMILAIKKEGITPASRGIKMVVIIESAASVPP
jgi:hypothetical protein